MICGSCGAEIDWIDCPTGGWWAHREHPEDDHEAEPPILTNSKVGNAMVCAKPGVATLDEVKPVLANALEGLGRQYSRRIDGEIRYAEPYTNAFGFEVFVAHADFVHDPWPVP